MKENPRSETFTAAVAEIDRQIEELQRTRETLLRLAANPGGPATTSPSSTGGAISGDPLATVREQEFSGMSWTQAARTFLQRIGRNEKTATIIAALNKGGVEVGGKNPGSALYTALGRHSAFVKLGKNYWDLAERRPDLAHGKVPKRASDKATKRRASTKKLKKLKAALTDTGSGG
jgi:hypothetical protein